MKIVRKGVLIFTAIFGLSISSGTQTTFSGETFDSKLAMESQTEETRHYHSVKGLADRVRRIEEHMKEDTLENWADRLTLSGLIEVEVGYEDFNFNNPVETDASSSDIVLAKVELGVDAAIAKHIRGHVLFLYEDDEDVVLDEGFIIIDGEDEMPLYLNAGKIYVPFGRFESHFISDPLTLELGETRESAVKVGFANELLDICFAVFNGDINETGEEDDHIDGYVFSAVLNLPEEAVSGLGLAVGASYISNIADSDGIQGALEDDFGTMEIKDYLAGFSAFLNASVMERFFMEVEYVGITEDFEGSDLGLAPGEKFQPRAWNLELAYAVSEKLEAAVRYEGSDDTYNLLPEKQYGAAVLVGLFENTSLAFEYLHGEFENDDKRDLFTCQLAIEF
ncbi:MAG: LbtU family siderophore porin [Thermodesulfobacteriota bacterium]|nr:LbtU family siderophore porin [Thermodesulfobacteriota bacterium]